MGTGTNSMSLEGDEGETKKRGQKVDTGLRPVYFFLSNLFWEDLECRFQIPTGQTNETVAIF